MMEYETRVTTVIVLPANEPIFSEMATEIAVVDESGGEFVEVRQYGRTDVGKIIIEPREWKMLRAAIDRMVGECRKVGGCGTTPPCAEVTGSPVSSANPCGLPVSADADNEAP